MRLVCSSPSPKVPRGAHRRPGRPLKPVRFGAESLRGERTEEGLEESVPVQRSHRVTRATWGTPEGDLRAKVHARTQPSGSLQKRVSSRRGPCGGWSYILPCGLTASFHTQRLYFNDNSKKWTGASFTSCQRSLEMGPESLTKLKITPLPACRAS